MKMYNWTKWAALFCLVAVVFTACKEDDDDDGTTTEVTKYEITPGTDAQAEAQTALIEMDNGDTVWFNGSSFDFTGTLSIEGKDNVVIMGNGRTSTILSFDGQLTGAEGLKVDNCNDIIMHGFTVQNTEGDAIKVKDCDGVVFRFVGAVWTGTPSPDNGAYGLYPVLCKNVLIDSCYARGASDAGIYVGQTTDVIVRNSIAEKNVAGIEIENTINADVYGNHSFDNTGGLLIFDLPGLTQYGANCRAFDNLIEENNRENFAPDGNIVSVVPEGTGVIILATAGVELYNNTIKNNNVMGVGMISYSLLEDFGETNNDPNYYVYPNNIEIRDNSFSSDKQLPPPGERGLFTQVIIGMFPQDSIPDILLDGYFDPADTSTTKSICIHDNGSARFANFDAANLLTPQQQISYDVSVHDCTHGNLPVVVIDVPE